MPSPTTTLAATWRRLGVSELAAYRLALAQVAAISAPAAGKVGVR